MIDLKHWYNEKTSTTIPTGSSCCNSFEPPPHLCVCRVSSPAVQARGAHVQLRISQQAKGLIKIYEHVRGKPGMSAARVVKYLADLADAEDAKLLANAKRAACDQYLATPLILHSDPCHYGSLVMDLMNQHTRGIDGYPETSTTAFDMLVSYKQPHQQHQLHAQDGGMAFTQDNGDDGGGSDNHAAIQDEFNQMRRQMW